MKYWPAAKILLALIFLLALFFYRGQIGNFLYTLRQTVNYFFKGPADYKRLLVLERENKEIKFELENLQTEKGQDNKFHYLISGVYTRYPFSDRNLLVVNAGLKDGLNIGMPVLAAKGILLGQIKTIGRTKSEVLTIFDPRWRSAVVIGSSRIKALLKGGWPPKLELIPLDSGFKEGDEVFNVSPEFPLNLFLGKVKRVEKDQSGFWLSGELETNFKSEELAEVIIITNFESN